MIVLPPATFELGGRTWTVHYKKQKDFKKDKDETKAYGECHASSCEIWLLEELTGDELAHTFLHELNHAIAYTMGWNKFNADEEKIDAHASLMLQFLKTKKGTP